MAAGLGARAPRSVPVGCSYTAGWAAMRRGAAFGHEVGLSREGVCAGLEDSGRGVGSTGGEGSLLLPCTTQWGDYIYSRTCWNISCSCFIVHTKMCRTAFEELSYLVHGGYRQEAPRAQPLASGGQTARLPHGVPASPRPGPTSKQHQDMRKRTCQQAPARQCSCPPGPPRPFSPAPPRGWGLW